MLIISTNKTDAIKAFINTWLKDPRWYCNNCGKNYGYSQKPKPPFTCCEEPQIGRNIDHTRGVIKQNKELRESRKNDYASNDARSMRMGVSLPPALLRDLERYFLNNYNVSLFENKGELHSFMRAFPMFCIARRV